MIRRCTECDVDFIDMVSKHHRNWKFLIDDTVPPKDEFTFKWSLQRPKHIYLKAIDGNVGVGYFLFVDNGDRTADCHVCFIPKLSKKNRELGAEAIEWIFKNTNIEKLNIEALYGKEAVVKYAKHLGFKALSNNQMYLNKEVESCHQ
jgi:hypothetical protein